MHLFLEQLKEEKSQLEDAIFILIEDFEKRNTGVSVDEVNIRKTQVESCGPLALVNVRTKVILS